MGAWLLSLSGVLEFWRFSELRDSESPCSESNSPYSASLRLAYNLRKVIHMNVPAHRAVGLLCVKITFGKLIHRECGTAPFCPPS